MNVGWAKADAAAAGRGGVLCRHWCRRYPEDFSAVDKDLNELFQTKGVESNDR